MLAKELLKENDFITVMLNNREYIIENIGRVFGSGDTSSSHRCLKIRETGSGCLLR